MNVSSATISTTATSTTTNVAESVRNVPEPGGRHALADERAGDRQHREQRQEARPDHRQAAEHVGERDAERAVVGAVRLDEAGVAGERRAVVVALRASRRTAPRRSPAGPEL